MMGLLKAHYVDRAGVGGFLSPWAADPARQAQAQAQAQARRRSPHLFITQVCRAADLASQLARAPPGGRGGFARYFQRRTAACPDKKTL